MMEIKRIYVLGVDYALTLRQELFDPLKRVEENVHSLELLRENGHACGAACKSSAYMGRGMYTLDITTRLRGVALSGLVPEEKKSRSGTVRLQPG